MKVTILVDNTALFDRYLIAEHGFSAFIEADGCRVLFDTGYSDAVIRNAHQLGIDLLHLDYIVLSHGHLDHTGGLYHLIRLFLGAVQEGRDHRLPQLIAHPHCFYPRPKPPLPDIGPMLTAEAITRHLLVNLISSPFPLSPNLIVLGEIKRTHSFEVRSPGSRRIVMPDGTVTEDHILDDTALACRTKDGLVIITGCAHAGICTTITYARKVTHEERILDIVGGLHLLGKGMQLDGTLEFLRTVQPSSLHACHCTSLGAKISLAGVVSLKETGVGLSLVYHDR